MIYYGKDNGYNLQHWKYISKHKGKNGKWVYVYKTKKEREAEENAKKAKEIEDSAKIYLQIKNKKKEEIASLVNKMDDVSVKVIDSRIEYERAKRKLKDKNNRKDQKVHDEILSKAEEFAKNKKEFHKLKDEYDELNSVFEKIKPHSGGGGRF